MDQNKLRDRERVVWGHIVQANRLLFRPGQYDSPANVVYEHGPSAEDSPALLASIAGALFDLKNQRHSDPELDECARWITNERLRTFDASLPRRLTRGRSMAFPTIMVHRKHLPAGCLSSPLFPMVINPEETPMTMILPHDYWPEGVEALGT